MSRPWDAQIKLLGGKTNKDVERFIKAIGRMQRHSVETLSLAGNRMTSYS